jgi:hypothetical protein
MKEILNSFEYLPRLSEFLDIRAEHRNKDFYFYVINYSTFITQPLTKGMFIPCDEEGNVLEEPVKEDYYVPMGEAEYHRALKQYQQAKDRALFEVFDVRENKHGVTMITIKNKGQFPLQKFKTIEDAINAGVKLKLKG